MSDEDTPFDDDELRAAGLVEQPEDLTPEEVFSLVMINKKRLVKTTIELRDEQGGVVPLHEVVADLLKYLESKLASGEESQVADQIFPMMAQAMVSGLGRLVGTAMTGFFLASDVMRMSTIQMMCISFLLLKYVQEKKLTIYSVEEPVQEEEIQAVERKAKANSIAMLGAMSGLSYKDILKELVDKGELTQEDLANMLNKDGSNDPGKLG
jgi:hypothetical protein